MYEPNETPFPFWGSSRNTKGGRDPLAVQNSSVVIYTNMITGITNVTARVRYNGFFCWLLTMIAEHLGKIDISKIDSPSEQIKLIRRGELLLAYIMLDSYPKITGVSGRIFAEKHFDEDIIDLSLGADYQNKPKIYWQNPNGIFGQYYIGVLSQLKLIYFPSGNHKTYRVTKDGLTLANIFSESQPANVEESFWKAISTGEIAKSKLKDMKTLALHLIENNKELDEYQRIFCQPDRQDYKHQGNYISHRIDSIKLILEYIRTEGNHVQPKDFVLSFLKYNFEHVLLDITKASDVQQSWFLYELNELTHAAYEAFHFAILYSISEEPQPLELIMEKLHDEFNHKVSNEHNRNIYVLYEKIGHSYKNEDYGALLYTAAQLLILLKEKTEPIFEELIAIANQENYDIQHPGFAPSLLSRLVDNTSIVNWTFVENCLYTAINDHLRSSYSKSSIGQGLVHNYMIEDDLIWQLRRTEPIRTSPRLQNVMQYIEDIKLIEKSEDNYNITERGLKILNDD